MRVVPEELATDMAEILDLYDAAARRFIEKVETGRARSTETYSDLKAALALSEEKGQKWPIE